MKMERMPHLMVNIKLSALPLLLTKAEIASWRKCIEFVHIFEFFFLENGICIVGANYVVFYKVEFMNRHSIAFDCGMDGFL